MTLYSEDDLLAHEEEEVFLDSEFEIDELDFNDLDFEPDAYDSDNDF